MKLTNVAKFLFVAPILAITLFAVRSSQALPSDPDADTLIAFTGNQSGSPQLYTMHPDGSHIVQITHLEPTPAMAFPADFSPDGRRIAFCYGNVLNDVPQVAIYIVNVDGTGLTQITHGVFDCVPRWSPDGSLISFAHQVDRTNRTVISTMRPDGSHIHDLTTDLWGAFSSGFTPDGRHIVWETQQAGFISVLWIMDSDGSHQRRLTPAPIKAGGPSTPSFNDVLAVSNLNSPVVLPNVLLRVKLDSGEIEQLTQPVGISHDLGVNYSPSRRHIVFASDRMNSNSELEIFTMNSDGSGMKRIATGITIGGCPDGNCVSPAWGRSPH